MQRVNMRQSEGEGERAGEGRGGGEEGIGRERERESEEMREGEKGGESVEEIQIAWERATPITCHKCKIGKETEKKARIIEKT